MPRYIDANKLIESLGDSVDACKKWVREMKARKDDEMIARSTQAETTLIEAILRTKAMPTADVVEVVRCKDCKYIKPTKLHNDEWYCIHYRYPMYKQDLNGFCSHGERRKDNE